MHYQTDFQKKVYKIVKKIPKGKVLTYKQIAKIAGHPKAWRAVGNVLNKNKNLHPPKFSKKILAGKRIPCHRVVRSNGKSGGYNRGPKKKLLKLKKEGVRIKRFKSLFKN